MIKSVLQAIPTYIMSAYLLPQTTLDDIERMINSYWWGVSGRGIRWMSWDKLTVSKEDGGMNFKNLQAFNLAMLGKQGWRFISNVDALVSRLFKAKYYPRGVFLEANLGHNPSYVWRSIWQSRVILRQGLKWRVGERSDINFWKEPCLRGLAPSLIGSAPHPSPEHLTVKDILIHDTMNWDMHFIHMLVPRDIAELINHMPTCFMLEQDKLIWSLTSNRIYSVKSAYKEIVTHFGSLEELKVEGEWKLLWKMQVPPKIKIFLWKACRDCLPTRLKLQSRGVLCPMECVLCSASMENYWHCFLTCPNVCEVWERAGLWTVIDQQVMSCESFKELVFKLHSSLHKEKFQLFVMLLWSIWRKMNELLWNAKTESVESTFLRATYTLAEWKKTHEVLVVEHHINHGSTTIDRWIPPPVGRLKCNCDAGFFDKEGRTSLACLRDHHGDFIHAKSSYFNVLLSVIEGEALAVLNTLQWLISEQRLEVTVESDCKLVVDRIHSHESDLSESGIIIKRVNDILSFFPSFKVVFSKRLGNLVAHYLARSALSFDSECIHNEIPQCILSTNIMETI